MLVEATGRVLPEVGPEMGKWTVEELTSRGIDVRRETLLKPAAGGHIVLDDGTEFVSIRKYRGSRPGICGLTWADAPSDHTISE
jgi:NADH dehydrogenase FAD-containing subunit